MSEVRLEAGIVTGDVAGLVRFYCEALGFSVERELSFSAGEVERAKAHGGSVITGVTNHRPGACYALATDPEGNVLELLQEAPEP